MLSFRFRARQVNKKSNASSYPWNSHFLHFIGGKSLSGGKLKVAKNPILISNQLNLL
jgi:hypothetical protein